MRLNHLLDDCQAQPCLHTPRLIVADEPTGNLDSQTGQSIVTLLRAIVQKTSIGILVATHDALVFTSADRIVRIDDGVVVTAH